MAIVNAAHTDDNQQFTIIGVIGTSGTADVTGSAKTLPVSVEALTGALYVNNIGPAGSVTLGNIPGGTLNQVQAIGGTVAVNVVAGGAGGGVADLQVRDASGTTWVDVGFGTSTLGTYNVPTFERGGSLAVVSALTNGSIVVTASTVSALPNIPGGTIGVVSALTNGSVVVTASTISAMPNIPGGTLGLLSAIAAGTLNTLGTVGVVSALTNGSVVVTASTVSALPNIPGGTIGVVSALTNGSIVVTASTVSAMPNIPGGTIGVVSALTNGSIVVTAATVTAGTVKPDGRPARNILTYGTVFGGAAAAFATIVGSASVGAGTSIWVTDLSIVNGAGSAIDCMIGFGAGATQGTSVLARGNFAVNGGIQKSFPLAVNAGMTNQDLVCWVGAAGTATFNVSYFISA